MTKIFSLIYHHSTVLEPVYLRYNVLSSRFFTLFFAFLFCFGLVFFVLFCFGVGFFFLVLFCFLFFLMGISTRNDARLPEG